MNRFFLIFFVIILITTNLNAKNLFETNFIFVEFESNDIENEKNKQIDILKKNNLDLIFKNILINQDYIRIKQNLNVSFADQFVKNIIIEDEKIVNNSYKAKIKIDFSKKLIVNFLREKKYPYVDYFPKFFFTIILENNAIDNNLFTKNNSYYNYLINNKNTSNFFKIPNLDLNDRFIASTKDFIRKDLSKIKKIIDKYQYENNIIIFASYEKKLYKYELYILKNKSLYLIDKYTIENLIYKNFFDDLNNRLVNFWKKNNIIQNNNQNKIKCAVSALNIYELKQINSLIKSVSSVISIDLDNISLNKNIYEIEYFGNQKILINLFYNQSMNIVFAETGCKISLI